MENNIDNTIYLLLIDETQSNYHHIKELLKQFSVGEYQWKIESVSNFSQARVVRNFRDYHAYLINSEVGEIKQWCQKVFPTPVILLTEDSNLGEKQLNEGIISDYIIKDELSLAVLKHCLRLCLINSDLRANIHNCQNCQNSHFNEDTPELESNFHKKLLHTIFDHSSDGILILDHANLVCFANDTATKLLGQSLSSMMGKNFRYSSQLNQTITEIEIHYPDSTLVVLEITKGNAEWQEHPATILIIRDITNQKEEARELLYFYQHLEGVVAEKTLALQETEIRFFQLAENIDSVFWITLVNENKFIYVSPAYEKIWGYSCESIYESTSTYLNSIHPEDKEKVIVDFAQQREGIATEIEYRIIDKQGDIHWIYTRSFPVVNDEAELERVVGISDDITERKQSQIELEKAQRRYETLAESVPIGIYRNDVKGDCIYVNQKTCQLLNVSDQECLGRGWEKFIHPDDAPRVLKSWQKAFEEKTFWQEEYRFLSKDNKIVWVMAQCIFTKNEQGEYTGSIGGLTDITVIKELEYNLKKSEQFTEAILNTIPIPVFWKNRDSILLGCNQIFADLCGLTKEEIINKSMLELGYSQHQAYKYFADDQKVIESANPKLFIQETYTLPDGELRWIETHKAPLFDENRQVVGLVGMFQDITERRAAEEALRQSEIRYRNLVDTLPAIIYSFSSVKGCFYVSPQVESILGYTVAELDTNPWLWNNSIHPEDINLATEIIFSGMAKEKFAIEYRIQDKEGNWHWFYDSCINLKFEGEEIRIDGIAIDITDRKRMEIALRESESSLKEAQQVAKLGNWSYEPDKKVSLWSKQVYKIFEQNPHNFTPTSTSFLRIVHQSDRRLVQEKYQQLLRQPRDYRLTYRILVNDGIKYIQECGRCLVDQNDKVIKIKGTVQDITASQKKEEALRRSEARFRRIFEQAAVGIAIITATEKIQKVNQKLADFFECQSSELINRDFREFTHPQDIPRSSQLVKKLVEGTIPSFSLDQRYYTKKNRVKWGNITITLERDSQNNPLYFICILDDIDARKQTEIMLKKAKKAADEANLSKSMFLANISHELRTPLNGILGFAQLMTTSDELPQQHQKDVSIINRAGEHLLSLINEIIDLAKIESGEVELNINCFDLDNLLESIKEIFSLKVAQKNLEFQITKADNVPRYVKTDQTKLRSILTNLIGNAFKFTHQGGIYLIISSETMGDTNQINLIFEVQDTGAGIPREEIDSLFEVFTQTTNGKNSGEGSGLGLAISRRFVHLMGGEIKVTSQINQGSIFTFNIKCEVGTAEQLSVNHALDSHHLSMVKLKPNQPHRRILIVEDDLYNLKLLEQLLKPHFEIQTAKNGLQGLQIWKKWQPHLILMDIKMPVMDGFQAIKTIRQQEKEKDDSLNPVKIIACTASTFESDKRHLLDMGSDDFLAKPFNLIELWHKLENHLGITFEYQKRLRNDTILTDNPPTKITVEDLSCMGYEWREKLYYAVLSARKEKTLELIKEIPQEKKELIDSLTFLTNQLNFEELMRLTDIDEE